MYTINSKTISPLFLSYQLFHSGGAIQRTHHWSPLSEEVKFVETQRDIEHGTFLCAKDRHVFPWCDVNARFGFIKYEEKKGDDDARLNIESG